jgi:hypothetical protein
VSNFDVADMRELAAAPGRTTVAIGSGALPSHPASARFTKGRATKCPDPYPDTLFGIAPLATDARVATLLEAKWATTFASIRAPTGFDSLGSPPGAHGLDLRPCSIR